MISDLLREAATFTKRSRTFSMRHIIDGIRLLKYHVRGTALHFDTRRTIATCQPRVGKREEKLAGWRKEITRETVVLVGGRGLLHT